MELNSLRGQQEMIQLLTGNRRHANNVYTMHIAIPDRVDLLPVDVLYVCRGFLAWWRNIWERARLARLRVLQERVLMDALAVQDAFVKYNRSSEEYKGQHQLCERNGDRIPKVGKLPRPFVEE